MWGSDANNVWAVGATGDDCEVERDGLGRPAERHTQNLYGVWGTDANNVWAVGERDAILKWNGTAWTAQTSGTTH